MLSEIQELLREIRVQERQLKEMKMSYGVKLQKVLDMPLGEALHQGIVKPIIAINYHALGISKF